MAKDFAFHLKENHFDQLLIEMNKDREQHQQLREMVSNFEETIKSEISDMRDENQELTETAENLEEEIKGLKEQNERFEFRIFDNERELADLRIKNMVLTKTVEYVTQKMDSSNRKLAQLSSRVSDQEREIFDLNCISTRLKLRFSDSQSDISYLKKQNDKIHFLFRVGVLLIVVTVLVSSVMISQHYT